jgi:FKBP-type peptidyl-prolyl cis-trans isomerase
MTRKRDRFFALFGAILFLVTASALTVAVVVSGIQSHNDSKKKAADTSSTTSQNDTSKSTNCSETSVAGVAAPLPSAYKPDGDVTSLQSTDLEQGDGPAAKSGDCLQVKYYGTLAKDGSVFDENFDKTSAFQFQLGKGGVIQGWDQGLVGVKAGATRRLVIPSDLGYGATGNTGIPPNADLVFVVKVLSIK